MINIDLLKSKSRIVRFLGYDFDVSYIPAAIEVPFFDEYQRQIKEQGGEDFDIEKIKEWNADPKNKQKGVTDLARLVSIYTSYYQPEIDAEQLLRDCNNKMLNGFFGELFKTMANSIEAKPVDGDPDSSKKK
jgi:hypothetical protein